MGNGGARQSSPSSPVSKAGLTRRPAPPCNVS